jgi:hypothetical protein
VTFGDRVVSVTVVHRFELAAVDGNNGMSEEFEPAAKFDKLSAHRPDRCAVVLTKVGDRLKVRRQPTGQPHQLDIALGFPFEPPARLNAVEIAVEVNLQQRRGMIGRSAVTSGITPAKPSTAKSNSSMKASTMRTGLSSPT